MRLGLAFLVGLAGPVWADPAACIAARDRDCLIKVLPELARQAVKEEPVAAEALLPQALVEMRQWDQIPAVLGAFEGVPLDEGWPLVQAYGYTRDVEAIEAYAAAISRPDAVPDGVQVVLDLALRDWDMAAVRALLDRRDIDLSAGLFALADEAASVGDFDLAYGYAARNSAEGYAATLQRIAWYAVQSGDDAAQRRIAAALETIGQNAPPLQRPGLFEQIGSLLSGDIDQQVGTFEQMSLPEIADDPYYDAIHGILAGLVYLNLGEDAQAEALISPRLGFMTREIEDYDAELDDVLMHLTAAAFEMGQLKTAERIFELRDNGAFVFDHIYFHYLSDEAAGYFITPAIDQMKGLIAQHLAGQRQVEYLDWHLEDGLYSEIQPLCERLISLDRAAEAAALHKWADVMLRARTNNDFQGRNPIDLLFFECHTPKTVEDVDALNPRLMLPNFETFQEAVDAADDQLAADLLGQYGDYAGSLWLLGLASSPQAIDMTGLVEQTLPELRQSEDDVRAQYPNMGDLYARLAVQLRLSFGLDGAADDFGRIDDPVEQTLAVIAALWALDPKPYYSSTDLYFLQPGFSSDVTVIPDFFDF